MPVVGAGTESGRRSLLNCQGGEYEVAAERPIASADTARLDMSSYCGPTVSDRY